MEKMLRWRFICGTMMGMGKAFIVLIIIIAFFAVIIGGYLLFINKPLSVEALHGEWKGGNEIIYTYLFHENGTFDVKGTGARGILSTVTLKLTGREDELTGRYSLAYHPLRGNILTLDFASGDKRQHRVSRRGETLIMDEVSFTKVFPGPASH